MLFRIAISRSIAMVASLVLLSAAKADMTQPAKTMNVRIAIRENPETPNSKCAYAASLSLSESIRQGNAIGWRIESLRLRQPVSPAECDRHWTASEISIPGQDNLWWVIHADADMPSIDEFDVFPKISGYAEADGDESYANLHFMIEGVDAPHEPGKVVLNYRFQLANQSDPDEGDEDDGDITDDGDVPIGMPGYDLNLDGKSDGRDIELFLQRCISGCDFNAADDCPLFIASLLGRSGDAAAADCNQNGASDGSDIFLGYSSDCNENGIPDECDIGFGSSNDANANAIPDECEPDCNGNGLPDDLDIADGHSDDENANGIPDECEPDCNANGITDDLDIAEFTSEDCDGDGIPDECNADCNGNGIADTCDIDPLDPDGDGIIYTDCNGDNLPDECDLDIPPMFGIHDCDGNLIPDSCDIANCGEGETWCQDCNANAIPDSCDIGAGISLDDNSNGIPDECESLPISPEEEQPPAPAEVSEELETLLDWSLNQEWGLDAWDSTDDQFLQHVDKCRELDVPVTVMSE